MKLASYVGIRPGIMGVGNLLIRLRLRGVVSHNEVVFEPADGPQVAALMPDGSLEPDANGALWCYSSVGLERLPVRSPRRGGHVGGTRFKRINLNGPRWALDPVGGDAVQTARMAVMRQGTLYDWQYIASFLGWFIPHKASRTACSEECAAVLGFEEAHRFDPCLLRAVVRSIKTTFSH